MSAYINISKKKKYKLITEKNNKKKKLGTVATVPVE